VPKPSSIGQNKQDLSGMVAAGQGGPSTSKTAAVSQVIPPVDSSKKAKKSTKSKIVSNKSAELPKLMNVLTISGKYQLCILNLGLNGFFHWHELFTESVQSLNSPFRRQKTAPKTGITFKTYFLCSIRLCT